MRFVGIAVMVLNVITWLALRRYLAAAFPARARRLAIVSAALFVIALHPSLLMTFGGWRSMRMLVPYLPQWLPIGLMAAQIALLFYWLLRGLLVLPQWALRRLGPDTRPPAAEEPIDPSRRRAVGQVALALPAIAVTTSAAGVSAARQTPVVHRIALPVRRELTELHGLTIAQISDVHVGSYMDRERLDDIASAVNALGADFHVITGDLLDNHVNQLELSTHLIRSMKPRRGEVFLCMGNHEYIAARTADVAAVVRGLTDSGGQLLIDEARKLRVGAHHFWLGGIDYPRRRRGDPRQLEDVRATLVHTLGQMADDGAPRIVLSHHPRTFIEGRQLPLDLMLSGHTHGGQFKLGRIGDYALTPVLPVDFYHNGFYEHAGRRLYVNAGAGGWLPLRLNCPPEITLVELVAA